MGAPAAGSLSRGAAMGASNGELSEFGLGRISKREEILALFPFMRERWPSWLPFGRPWTERDRLAIYHALAPFREHGELTGARSVILAAARRRRSLDRLVIDRLLVGLRYLDADERAAAYRDPEAWLARVDRLATAASALRAHVSAAARSARPGPRPGEAVADAGCEGKAA